MKKIDVQIKYRNDEVRKLYGKLGIKSGVKTSKSAGFDLVTAEDVTITFRDIGASRVIDLGVVIQVPEGYHCLLMPRSSMFKKWGIIQANSVGLIDQDYCGKDDYWGLAITWLGKMGVESQKHAIDNRTFTIPKGTALCQFIPQETIVIEHYNEFEPEDKSRGGFGSTGN